MGQTFWKLLCLFFIFVACALILFIILSKKCNKKDTPSSYYQDKPSLSSQKDKHSLYKKKLINMIINEAQIDDRYDKSEIPLKSLIIKFLTELINRIDTVHVTDALKLISKAYSKPNMPVKIPESMKYMIKTIIETSLTLLVGSDPFINKNDLSQAIINITQDRHKSQIKMIIVIVYDYLETLNNDKVDTIVELLLLLAKLGIITNNNEISEYMSMAHIKMLLTGFDGKPKSSQSVITQNLSDHNNGTSLKSPIVKSKDDSAQRFLDSIYNNGTSSINR
jgi:hypothetical protein